MVGCSKRENFQKNEQNVVGIMNYKDLAINLNIALSRIPEQYVPEIVDRIQKSSVAILSEYTSNVQAEKIIDKSDKIK